MKVFLVAVIATVATVTKAGGPTQAQLEAGIKLLDKNGNGFIEKNEMGVSGDSQAIDAGWKLAVQLGDGDKDGKLSVSEFAAYSKLAQGAAQGGPPPSPDANHDGFITKDEMVAVLGADKVTDSCWEAMLKRADKDKDMKMSPQEFTEATSTGKMPEACSGASAVTQIFSVMTLLAVAISLF